MIWTSEFDLKNKLEYQGDNLNKTAFKKSRIIYQSANTLHKAQW